MSIKKAINYIVDNIKLDYQQQFDKSYKEEEELRKYKNHLLEKLKGYQEVDIKTGYDNYVLSANPFLPTFPNLVIFINSAQKVRLNKEKNYIESSTLAALPPPKIIQCDPVKLLADTKHKDEEYTPEERRIKHAENMAKHQALLTKFSHQIKHVYADQSHLCEIPGCPDAGSMSNSNKGGGNFYCSAHYFRMS
jgi:hypothetical protein